MTWTFAWMLWVENEPLLRGCPIDIAVEELPRTATWPTSPLTDTDAWLATRPATVDTSVNTLPGVVVMTALSPVLCKSTVRFCSADADAKAFRVTLAFCANSSSSDSALRGVTQGVAPAKAHAADSLNSLVVKEAPVGEHHVRARLLDGQGARDREKVVHRGDGAVEREREVVHEYIPGLEFAPAPYASLPAMSRLPRRVKLFAPLPFRVMPQSWANGMPLLSSTIPSPRLRR